MGFYSFFRRLKSILPDTTSMTHLDTFWQKKKISLQKGESFWIIERIGKIRKSFQENLNSTGKIMTFRLSTHMYPIYHNKMCRCNNIPLPLNRQHCFPPVASLYAKFILFSIAIRKGKWNNVSPIKFYGHYYFPPLALYGIFP